MVLTSLVERPSTGLNSRIGGFRKSGLFGVATDVLTKNIGKGFQKKWFSQNQLGLHNQSWVRELVTRGEGVSTPQRPFRVPYDKSIRNKVLKLRFYPFYYFIKRDKS